MVAEAGGRQQGFNTIERNLGISVINTMARADELNDDAVSRENKLALIEDSHRFSGV
jgi:hypothetical protein